MTPHPRPMLTTGKIARKTPPRRLTAGWGCNPRLVECLRLVEASNLIGAGNGVFNTVEITGDRAAIPAVMTWNRNTNNIVGGRIMAVSLGAELLQFYVGSRKPLLSLLEQVGAASLRAIGAGGGGLCFGLLAAAEAAQFLRCFVLHGSRRLAVSGFTLSSGSGFAVDDAEMPVRILVNLKSTKSGFHVALAEVFNGPFARADRLLHEAWDFPLEFALGEGNEGEAGILDAESSVGDIEHGVGQFSGEPSSVCGGCCNVHDEDKIPKRLGYATRKCDFSKLFSLNV